MVTIADNASLPDQATFLLTPPAPCSTPDPCEITENGYDQGPCNDNGTGNISTDDTYQLTINAPSIANGCGEYQVFLNGNIEYTGADATTSLTVAANGQSNTITLSDACDSQCTVSYLVPGVDSCSVPDPCDMTAGLIISKDSTNYE